MDHSQKVSDHSGIHQAYNNINKIMIIGDTLYIAGTSDIHDVLDWIRIPLHIHQGSKIYKRAEEQIKNYSKYYTPLKNIVGHSAGAITAKLLGDKYNIPYQMYGAPRISIPGYGQSHSISNYGDPVSFMDFNAIHRWSRSYNPHSY